MASAYRGFLCGKSQRSKGGLAGPGEGTEVAAFIRSLYGPFPCSPPERAGTGARQPLWSSESVPLPETAVGAARGDGGGHLMAGFCIPPPAGMVLGWRKSRPVGRTAYLRVGECEEEWQPPLRARTMRKNTQSSILHLCGGTWKATGGEVRWSHSHRDALCWLGPTLDSASCKPWSLSSGRVGWEEEPRLWKSDRPGFKGCLRQSQVLTSFSPSVEWA